MIVKKRIRKSKPNLLPYIAVGDKFQVGCPIESLSDPILKKIGFDNDISVGHSILPSDKIGIYCRRNSQGYFGPPKRELPKVPYSVDFTSTIKDWHGYDHDVQISQTRQKFQRDYFKPKCLNLKIVNDINGKYHLVSDLIKFGKNEEDEKYLINMLLEIFGKCEIYNERGARIINAPVKLVKWKMLPPGTKDWDSLKDHLKENLRFVKKQHKEIVEGRLKIMNSFKPDEINVGLGGFSEYLAFEFKIKNIWILECVRFGNATYIMGNNWKSISKLTKSEVIQGKLAQNRIIHSKTWDNEILKNLK